MRLTNIRQSRVPPLEIKLVWGVPGATGIASIEAVEASALPPVLSFRMPLKWVEILPPNRPQQTAPERELSIALKT